MHVTAFSVAVQLLRQALTQWVAAATANGATLALSMTSRTQNGNQTNRLCLEYRNCEAMLAAVEATRGPRSCTVVVPRQCAHRVRWLHVFSGHTSM